MEYKQEVRIDKSATNTDTSNTTMINDVQHITDTLVAAAVHATPAHANSNTAKQSYTEVKVS